MPGGVDGPLNIGSTFLSKYEIRALLGRGGHACVYHAVNTFMGRHVAIKVLHRPGGVGPEALRRGQAEAQILNRLRHPNIVEVIDAGTTDDGLLYIIMELLEGRTLRELLNEHGSLSIDEALALAAELAEGLRAAHQTGAIHRDLKPENVFVTHAGAIKILDFGIAKVADAAAWTTDKDVAHGTVLYMSPEQLQAAKLTPRSDIYALGVVTFEALLGRHPILMLLDAEQATVWEIARAVLTREPRMLNELDPRISRDIAALVNRAMAKQPEQRFASMEELASAVRECRELWLAHAKTHGIALPERILGRGQPRSGGYAAVSKPRPSPPALANTGTAAPVTTRTAPQALPPRRSQLGQTVVWGCLFGAAVGSSWAWLRSQPPHHGPSEASASPPAASDAASSAMQSQTVAPALPAASAGDAADPSRDAADTADAAATASAVVTPRRSAPRAVPQAKTKNGRPASTSPDTATAKAPTANPSAPPRKPEDRVDLRLKRLEQTLGPADSDGRP